MSPKGALVVIGSGPGIGRTTAAYFAEQGFQHIILLSRNTSRLVEDAKFVSAASSDTKVETLTIDMAADEAKVKTALAQVDKNLKAAAVPLEAVLYNAARVAPSKIMDWEAKGLEEDLKTTTVNLYVTLQWAVPQLLATSKLESLNPAFLVTSGGLYKDPYPHLFSLSAAKASQHNLIHSFHKEFEPSIHFSCVPVSGLVSDDAKLTTAKAIAEQFWELYSQPKGTKGKVSVEMHDPDYLDGVEMMRKMVDGK